jgi:hypothetical protein
MDSATTLARQSQETLQRLALRRDEITAALARFDGDGAEADGRGVVLARDRTKGFVDKTGAGGARESPIEDRFADKALGQQSAIGAHPLRARQFRRARQRARRQRRREKADFVRPTPGLALPALARPGLTLPSASLRRRRAGRGGACPFIPLGRPPHSRLPRDNLLNVGLRSHAAAGKSRRTKP